MSTKEDVRARYDLPTYIKACGVMLKKSGSVYLGRCPFHTDATPSFAVYEDGFKCFGCGEHGDLFRFVELKFGLSFPEALERLASEAGIVLDKQAPRPNAQYEQHLLEIIQQAQAIYHNYLFSDNPDAQQALAYLTEERDLTVETIKAFGIGYAPESQTRMKDYLLRNFYRLDVLQDAGLVTDKEFDRFSKRILFPIRDKKGVTRGFGGRGDNPKYLNSPNGMIFNKSELLFGFDLAHEPIHKSKTAIVVEGYMDAVQVWQAGHPNVVAQLGTAITEPQIRLLQNHANTLIFALDNDHAGQSATQRAIVLATDILQRDLSARYSLSLKVLRLDDKDPDEFVRKHKGEFGKRITEAQSIAQYLIEVNRAQLGVGADETTRINKAMELLPILETTQNDAYKATYRQMLESAMGLPEGTLAKIAKNRANSNTTPHQDKTHTNKQNGKAEAQILATVLQSDTGLQKYFELSGALLEMGGVEHLNADTLAYRGTFLEHGFYPLSESDFQDSQYQEVWWQFQPNLGANDIQSAETLAQLMTVKPLTFDQLLIAVVNIRKRHCQHALDAGVTGQWAEAKQKLMKGLAL